MAPQSPDLSHTRNVSGDPEKAAESITGNGTCNAHSVTGNATVALQVTFQALPLCRLEHLRRGLAYTLYKYSGNHAYLPCLPTHHRGRRLRSHEWTYVPGPVSSSSIYQQSQNRFVNYLRVVRQLSGGATAASLLPDLGGVRQLAFSTDRAMIVSYVADIFEEVEGYQGWYVV